MMIVFRMLMLPDSSTMVVGIQKRRRVVFKCRLHRPSAEAFLPSRSSFLPSVSPVLRPVSSFLLPLSPVLLSVAHGVCGSLAETLLQQFHEARDGVLVDVVEEGHRGTASARRVFIHLLDGLPRIEL